MAANAGCITLHDAVTNAVGPCLFERTNKGREISVVWQRLAGYDMDTACLSLQLFETVMINETASRHRELQYAKSTQVLCEVRGLVRAAALFYPRALGAQAQGGARGHGLPRGEAAWALRSRRRRFVNNCPQNHTCASMVASTQVGCES